MTHEEYKSKSQMKRVEILKAGEKQMTHEELLDAVKDNPTTRAVVELHKPFVRDDITICNLACSDEGGYLEHYPCPTISTIERLLNDE